MRVAWCRRAVLDFGRRWGVYMAVLALAMAAGADSAMQIVLALAAWLALPLFWAAAHGAWLLPAVALQAAVGAGCVWGLRPLLWPARWAGAERALPIPRAALLRSDAAVVALGLTPLWLLQAAGAANVLGHDPAWLRPTRWLGLAALVLAGACSEGLGVAVLQGLRAPARPRRPGRSWGLTVAVSIFSKTPDLRATRRRRPAARWRAMPWPRALLWLPLWHGPAQRSGRLQWQGSAALALPGLVVGVWPAATPWWLAAWAATALVVVTRLHAVWRDDSQVLFDACRLLPLRPRWLQRARSGASLWPLLPGGAALGAGLGAGLSAGLPGSAGLRPAVLAAYAAACVGSCTAEVMATPADAAAKSSRWLFCLVLCLALASEVVA